MPGSHIPHNDEADRHKGQIYCTQNAHLNEVTFDLGLLGFVLEGQPGLSDPEEEDQQPYASETDHDIGRDSVVHVVLVVLAVCDFVEHGHDNVDEAQHTGQRDVEVEVSGVFEGNCPAEGEEHEEDDQNGVRSGVQKEVEYIENSMFNSGAMSIHQEPNVLEENRIGSNC